MLKLEKLSSILLIDDDTNTNFLNEKMIKRTGISVFLKSFSDARKALAFLEGSCAGTEAYPQPGIIFLDLNMPGMNGWTFMEHYGKLPEDLKAQTRVVVLTSSIDRQDTIRAAEDSNISHFMSKPLLKESLMNVVADYFETFQTLPDSR